MEPKKHLIEDKFIIGLALLIILAGLILSAGSRKEAAMPQAHYGVLDARGWDFTSGGLLLLNGEWEFYPDRLLQPGDFSPEPARYAKVPNASRNWQGKAGKGPWGCATYRLKVMLKPSDTLMGLKINSIQTSNKVFLDGKLVIQVGSPGYSREEYTPGNHPKETFFNAGKGELEIVVQVANYDYYTTGFVAPVIMGRSDQIIGTTLMQYGLQFASVLVAAVFGIYYLYLFLFNRKDKSLLFFGASFSVFSFQILFEGEKLIFQLFPGMPHDVFWKTRLILTCVFLSLILLHTWLMMSPWKYRHVILPPTILLICHSLAVFVLPMHVMGQAGLMFFMMCVYTMGLVLAFGLLLAAYMTGQYGQFMKNELRIYILAIICLFVLTISTILFVNAVIMSNIISNLIRIIFALLITLMLVQRSAHNLLSTERMAFDVLKNEMAFLQAQIKPHFLYNAINTISAFSLDDSQMTRDLLAKLSQYLRGSFDFKNRDQLVSLHRELELVEAYLFIEKARFGERLRVVYDIDESVDCLMPPLIIQPLVENAVQHGLSGRKNGGTIAISIWDEQDFVTITVDDDGVGIDDAVLSGLYENSRETGGSVALTNIHQRLMRMYSHGLEIQRKADGGTKIAIRIMK